MLRGMVAVTTTPPPVVDGDDATVDHAVAPTAPARAIGLVPTASLVTGAAIALVWFWVPLTILIVGVSSIPSLIGFVLAAVVFVYLMRGVDRVERVRSEAVFGLGIGIPPRKLSPYNGFQRWAHQLWLDVSSARFWKGAAHHYLRMLYDVLAAGLAFGLVVFALSLIHI